MKSRETIKKEVLEIDSNYLIVSLPTGTGKTKVALDNTYQKGVLFPDVLIVIPKLNMEQDWTAEYIKWGYGNDLQYVTFTTYNSFGKHLNKHWDMIIFDEGHHITDRIMELIDHKKISERVMILSATIKPSLGYKLKTLFPGIQTYKVREKEAIESGILPDPKIILLPLILNTTDKTELIVKNPKQKIVKEIPFNTRMYYRDKVNRYEIHCTEEQYYIDMSDKIDWYKRKSNSNPFMKNLWLHKCGDRLKWLAARKNKYVQQLLNMLEKERVLTFCASIEQTEQLGSNCIHSKNKNADEILKSFNKEEINHVTSVAMLDEGKNLSHCRIGIFANINSSDRIQIQRVGRILRHESPIIIIPYYKGTREDEIVTEMIEGYNPEKIVTFNSIEDIVL